MQTFVEDDQVEAAFEKLWQAVYVSDVTKGITAKKRSIVIDCYAIDKFTLKTEDWKVTYGEVLEVDGSFMMVQMEGIEREAFIAFCEEFHKENA